MARELLEKTAYSGFPHFQRLDNKADYGSFIDPDKNQYLIDFYEARNAGTAATIEFLAKTVKQTACHEVVVGAFHGSLASGWYHGGGNMGPTFLRDSNYVDFLSAPTTYIERIPGGGASFRTPVDTLMYRDKLWFNESDMRTWHVKDIRQGQVFTAEQTREVFKREFGQIVCDDVQGWWYDINEDLACPELAPMLKIQQDLAEKISTDSFVKSPEIAFIYDQESVWFSAPETNRDLLHLNRIFEVPRIGASADHILLDDLELDNLPDYKMMVFVNCFKVNNQYRALIKKKYKNNNRFLVWIYAAGLINPDASPKISLENMSELTGFNYDQDMNSREGTFRICTCNKLLAAGLSDCCDYGRYMRPMCNGFCWEEGFKVALNPSLLNPLFYIINYGTEILGRFITNGQPSWALKEQLDWTSVFLGSNVMNSAVMRCIASLAGVHIYSYTDDIFYANNQFITIHSSYKGMKRIHLKDSQKKVQDVYSGEELIADADGVLELEMPFGHTRMFRCL